MGGLVSSETTIDPEKTLRLLSAREYWPTYDLGLIRINWTLQMLRWLGDDPKNSL